MELEVRLRSNGVCAAEEQASVALHERVHETRVPQQVGSEDLLGPESGADARLLLVACSGPAGAKLKGERIPHVIAGPAR